MHSVLFSIGSSLASFHARQRLALQSMSYTLSMNLAMPTGTTIGDAKKLAKRKFEALGASGVFEGYQPDLQHPRTLDADEDSVVNPGSTLSFRSTLPAGQPAEDRLTMLERGASAMQDIVAALQHTVAKPMLIKFVCLVCSRQLGKVGQQRSEVKPSRGMQDAVSKGGLVATAVQNFISKADPELHLTPASVATAMDSNYDCHNDQQHVNNNERLASVAVELHAMQAVDILRSSMPVECEILIHYKTLCDIQDH